MKIQTKKSERQKIVDEYVQKYNPYEKTVPLGFNVAEMSKYAQSKNISISELSIQEAKMFEVDSQ